MNFKENPQGDQRNSEFNKSVPASQELAKNKRRKVFKYDFSNCN